MTALAAHLPPLLNTLAFAAIVITISLGYLYWETRHAPRRDDWASSGDTRRPRVPVVDERVRADGGA